nr:Flp family type IVb pilin [uncultured Lichenicoccus sp.]
MLNIVQAWTGLRLDRRGVTALEYAIIAGVLGTVLVTVFTGLGAKFTTVFAAIEKTL